MAEVKWIKITTDMFDDEKIDFIGSLPEADAMIVIWVRLITLAGRCNAGGYIFLTEKIPYTEEMLAHTFRKPLNVVKLALDTFQKLGMIEFTKKGILLINFEKYQNIEGLDKIKEQNRLRASKYRERLQLAGGYDYLEHYGDILKRDGRVCVYCGSVEGLCLDHLIPLIKGGDNGKDNLVLSCKKCNSGKAGRYFEETGYTFLNSETAEQYEKVKQRLKITHSVTHNHAIDIDIDIDKEIKHNTSDVVTSDKPKNKKNNKIFPNDSTEIKLSKKLFDLMRSNNPSAKEPNYQSWAKSIDLMLRLDNRTPELIADVIEWCQSDSFWKCNILSTSKLREKFDALTVKMNQKGGSKGGTNRQVSEEQQFLDEYILGKS